MNYPKIGIRPAIDGRQGGVRESLEAQTMAMAETAKLLIEGELRYADGEPVQCVVASRTIGEPMPRPFAASFSIRTSSRRSRSRRAGATAPRRSTLIR